MMQQLMADRFALKAHFETKELLCPARWLCAGFLTAKLDEAVLPAT